MRINLGDGIPEDKDLCCVVGGGRVFFCEERSASWLLGVVQNAGSEKWATVFPVADFKQLEVCVGQTVHPVITTSEALTWLMSKLRVVRYYYTRTNNRRVDWDVENGLDRLDMCIMRAVRELGYDYHVHRVVFEGTHVRSIETFSADQVASAISVQNVKNG
jgi:hypothetical protein